MRTTTYGPGGYDPTKPDGNIIEEVEHPDPEPVEDTLPAATRGRVEDAVAVSAVADNDAWLANPSKDLTEQVKALTRQVNTLMGKTEPVKDAGPVQGRLEEI